MQFFLAIQIYSRVLEDAVQLLMQIMQKANRFAPSYAFIFSTNSNKISNLLKKKILKWIEMVLDNKYQENWLLLYIVSIDEL